MNPHDIPLSVRTASGWYEFPRKVTVTEHSKPDLYSKPEVLLGDLRQGLCSSGLCRQLRAVAADEIERLAADAANEQAEKDSLAAIVKLRDSEIGRFRARLEDAFDAGWRTAANWMNRDDLLADIGSPAYLADRQKAIGDAK